MKKCLSLIAMLALAGCGGESAPVKNVPPNEPPSIANDPPPTDRPCFRLYEAMYYSGEPDLLLYGFKHIDIIDPHHEPQGQLSTDPNAETIVVDWEYAVSDSTDPNEAFPYARQSGYTGPVSLYATLPKRDYWRSIAPTDSADYKAWQAENDAVKPVVAKVEAIFPSLYTFYANEDGWVAYAKANMSEGRRIAPTKKMYPFLWPNYHGIVNGVANGVLPGDYWLKQLRTVRDSGADGVVIWAGWDFDTHKPLPWDENFDWWKATQQFINETPNICK